MEQLASAAFFLGAAAYTAATIFFFMDLARRDGSPDAARWAPVALGVGAALHLLHVISASLLSRVCPVESLHFALSLTALIAAGAYLALRSRFGLQAIGAFISPAALTFL